MNPQHATSVDRPRRVALVTGASAGIGRAFAIELARRGYEMVLVARRRERLDELAAHLRTTGTIAHVVVADLSDPAAPTQIINAALERCGSIDVLVNNAGYGLPTRFGDTTWDAHRAFLDVMLTSVVALTHRVLPLMLARGWGRIINVASVAAFAPEPAGSLYPATKAFMVSFSRALALELAGTGVHVTALCPGFTTSEFHDVLGNREHMNTLPAFLWLDAHHVARAGLDACDRGRVIVIPGVLYKLIVASCCVLPFGLLQRLGPRSLMSRHDTVR